MKTVWSKEAIFDLVELRAYISENSPDAARRVAIAVLHAVEAHLHENPAYGRPGRVPGTREMVVPKTPVVVPYRVRGNRLEILRVYHHARVWPDHF